MRATAEYELSIQLYAGRIDSSSGTIEAATVAQAGVRAIGKYIMLDKDGNLTGDPKLAARKLEVVTDDETLNTLMAAAQAAGGKFKVRSDHDDSLESRAGFAVNFRKLPAITVDGREIPARVVCDLKLNDSYRDRSIVLETAQKTPELIGLSIDMTPRFEIDGPRALMRIKELLAVDIVDEGAITHSGLFLSRGVDSAAKVTITEKSDPSRLMSEKKDPTLQDCMAAITELSSHVASLAKSNADLAAKYGAAGKVVDKDKDEMSALKESNVQLAAGLKELTEKFSGVSESIVTMKKEQAALGLKAGDTAGKGASAGATDDPAGKGGEKPKTYLELVDAEVAGSNGKLRRSDAHEAVQRAHPDAYRLHIKAKGIV